MPVVSDDYYSLLGVDRTFTSAELRKKWRRLVLRWHPDRAGAETTAIFQMLSAAYSVLSDPVARAAYDRAHPRPRSPVESRPSPRAPRDMLSRITGPLESLTACGVARQCAENMIELYLDGVEAAQGGMVTISMNVEVRCTRCAAARFAQDCALCAGTGKVQHRYSAWLSVPPGVADGTVLTPSVGLPGMIDSPAFRVRAQPS
jgi:molecular chaperone DnaJ